MTRRRLKFAAVLVVVVLALTGFSSSRTGKRGGGSKGSRSSSGGGGGGCSSPKKSNGSYSGSHSHSNDDSDDDSDDDYDDYDSSGSSGSTGDSYDSYTGGPTPTATAAGVEARIVTCVRGAKGKRKAVTYATVRVETAPGPADVYDIVVTFTDSTGGVVDTGETKIELDGGGTKTVRVAMDSPRQVTRVRKCAASAALDT